MEMPRIQRPTPRRIPQSSPNTSDHQSIPSPPYDSPVRPYDIPRDSFESHGGKLDVSAPPSRPRSVLNLTASTLAGIYSSAIGDGAASEVATPWGTGAQTPSFRRSLDASDRMDFFRMAFDPSNPQSKAKTPRLTQPRKRKNNQSVLWQTSSLFAFGIGFGLLVTHLHRTQQIAPVPVPSFAQTSWGDQLAWGMLGVLVGNAFPWIDNLFSDDGSIAADGAADNHLEKKTTGSSTNATKINSSQPNSAVGSSLGPLWLSAVRSIGAFVGIAFAVRRVPWQSTLQVSSTLAATNPVLWYLIDRSKSGFALSTTIGIFGSVLLLLFSPDFVPMPAIHRDQASEKFGVYMWLASILFCTSCCFGAIGRRLQL